MSGIPRKRKTPPIPGTDLELAWAAGFFDGEGSVGYYINNYANKKCRTWSLSVTQKDLRPLERFKIAVGNIGYIRRVCDGIHAYQVTDEEGIQFIYGFIGKYLSEPKKEQFARAQTRRLTAPPTYRLTDNEYMDVRFSKLPTRELAIKYNISKSYIRAIRNGSRQAHRCAA